MIRFSVIDLCAVIILLVVFLMPARDYRVEPVYADTTPADVQELAIYQAALADKPGDGAVAADLANVFRRINQNHYAMRVAGEAARRGGPQAWRGWLAISEAHADRVEIDAAFDFATRALRACEEKNSDCPDFEHIRLQVYHHSLDTGIQSGIDPRVDPEGFRRELLRAFPRAHFRTGRR